MMALMGTSMECRMLADAPMGLMEKSMRVDAGLPYTTRYDNGIYGNFDGMPYASGYNDGILKWYNTNFVT